MTAPRIVRLRSSTRACDMPQCDEPARPVNTYAKNWRKQCAKGSRHHGRDPERCFGYAAFEIEGKNYCAVHAGEHALRILMDSD